MACKSFVRIVPGKSFARAICDVGQQSAFRQAIAVIDIARGALPRLDGIQKLADMTGRIWNGRSRGFEILLLLAVNPDFIGSVVSNQIGLGALKDYAAAHVVVARAALWT